MRIHVRHETAYTYETPPKSIIQVLKLTPRSHEGQHVIDWRIDCDADCRLKPGEDAFGNITYAFTVNHPVSSLKLGVEGEVETFGTSGLVARAVERFPPLLFLRETGLTQPHLSMRDLAPRRRDTLEFLHGLMAAIHERMIFDPDPTHSGTTACEALQLGRGVCQDYAHMFIAAARLAEIPARYIGGHFCRIDGQVEQTAGHAWAEAWVENLGWVGFDPANGICVQETHIRVACGLDYLGAAPVRGARNAGTGETLKVHVTVAQASAQSQN